MMKLAISPAASALLRALLARAGVSRDRILLTEWRSTDWQSLTLMGERHDVRMRIPGPEALGVVEGLVDGLEEAEFSIAGHLVADIICKRPSRALADGSMEVAIEALTIAMD
jgi:phosphoribosylamine-glycine ligase